MELLLVFFIVSLSFSFLCSILEAVLLCITPAYVAIQKHNNSPIAPDLIRFKDDIDRPLTAILTLNTTAHTVGAIGVGAQAAQIFGAREIELLGISAVSWEAIIAGWMTLCILILSEVIPKTLGANNWEVLTPYVVAILKVMMFLLAPFVWAVQFITRNLKKDKDKPVFSRSEFKVITKLGTASGALNENEQHIIENLLKFSGILVRDVMTPRIVVFSASDALSIREFHDTYASAGFSRIPIFHQYNDNVTGYVLQDELLTNLAEKQDSKLLGELRRDIIVVHETMPIPELLDKLITEKEHLALVVDEFGGMEGVVTMEDIIETLLGMEIVDESDNTDDMQTLARKNWQKRAKRMGLTLTPEEN